MEKVWEKTSWSMGEVSRNVGRGLKKCGGRCEEACWGVGKCWGRCGGCGEAFLINLEL